MRKLAEIDSVKTYAELGQLPLLNTWTPKRRTINRDWYYSYFNPSQRTFLEQHGYSIRPHPRHNPTLELFINETEMTDRDWTIAHLLFQND